MLRIQLLPVSSYTASDCTTFTGNDNVDVLCDGVIHT